MIEKPAKRKRRKKKKKKSDKSSDLNEKIADLDLLNLNIEKAYERPNINKTKDVEVKDIRSEYEKSFDDGALVDDNYPTYLTHGEAERMEMERMEMEARLRYLRKMEKANLRKQKILEANERLKLDTSELQILEQFTGKKEFAIEFNPEVEMRTYKVIKGLNSEEMMDVFGDYVNGKLAEAKVKGKGLDHATMELLMDIKFNTKTNFELFENRLRKMVENAKYIERVEGKYISHDFMKVIHDVDDIFRAVMDDFKPRKRRPVQLKLQEFPRRPPPKWHRSKKRNEVSSWGSRG